jgi:hypothetical protein
MSFEPPIVMADAELSSVDATNPIAYSIIKVTVAKCWSVVAPFTDPRTWIE